MIGWQRESTDGPKRWFECVFFWSGPQLLDVVWCSVIGVVVVVVVPCSAKSFFSAV